MGPTASDTPQGSVSVSRSGMMTLTFEQQKEILQIKKEQKFLANKLEKQLQLEMGDRKGQQGWPVWYDKIPT